jgi:hypothetical protein
MPRKWPEGRVSGDDDGETHMAIAAGLEGPEDVARYRRELEAEQANEDAEKAT